MGSSDFLVLALALLALSHTLTVIVAAVLRYEYDVCLLGSSSMLFALKVVANHSALDGATESSVYGFRLPSRYAVWAELAIIQLIYPGSSFIGHACGICAGLLWLHGGHLGARLGAWAPARSRTPSYTYDAGFASDERRPRAPPHAAPPQSYFAEDNVQQSTQTASAALHT